MEIEISRPQSKAVDKGYGLLAEGMDGARPSSGGGAHGSGGGGGGLLAEGGRGTPRESLLTNASRPSGERSGGGGAGFGLLADTDVRPSSPSASVRQPQHREGGGGLLSDRAAAPSFSDRDRLVSGDGHGLMVELASADKPRSRDASPAGARLDTRPSSLYRDVMERDLGRSGTRSDALDPGLGRLKVSDPGYGLLAEERRSSGGGLDSSPGRGAAPKPGRAKEEESYGLFADAGQKPPSFPAKDLLRDRWRDPDRDEDRITGAPYSPRAEDGRPAGRKASEGVSAAGLLDNLRMRPPGRHAVPGSGINGKSHPAGNPHRAGGTGGGGSGGGRGSLDAYGLGAESDQWGGMEGREGPPPYVKSSSSAGAQGKLPSSQPVLQVTACLLIKSCLLNLI